MRCTGNIIPAIHSHSSRVTCNKKGGNQNKIPYSIGIAYTHPPVDNVPLDFRVEVPEGTEIANQKIETVEEAIDVYWQAYCQKFHSREGRRHRKRSLQMFLQYLTAKGHSLKLKDITLAEGQGFLE